MGDKPSLPPPGSNEVPRARVGRLLLLLAGGVSLAAGVWAGLIRGGVPLPGGPIPFAALHGPFMIPGFLGTLIGLERAVGAGVRWPYAAPAASTLGTVFLLAGAPALWSSATHLAASIVLTATMCRLLWQHRAWYTALFVFAACCLAIGNLLWLRAAPMPLVSSWWLAFLVGTIAGERMELSRVVAPPAWAQPTLVASFSLLVLGTLAGSLTTPAGAFLFGLGLLAIALGLIRFDVAWRTLKHTGLPRFVALALLSGFAWLAVAGIVAALDPVAPIGARYDAVLHAVFLGFVFAMIFAHAPMILPAVLGKRLPFHLAFYIPLVVLHLSVGLRIGGDLLGSWFPRMWGMLGNVAAIVLFLITAMVQALRSAEAVQPHRARLQR